MKTPYPHVFTEVALPEAIYSELEATFPEEQILGRVQRMDGGSPTRRLKTPEALAWRHAQEMMWYIENIVV